MVSPSNYKQLLDEVFVISGIIVFMPNFMKSSAVYEASLCTFVLRFD